MLKKQIGKTNRSLKIVNTKSSDKVRESHLSAD